MSSHRLRTLRSLLFALSFATATTAAPIAFAQDTKSTAIADAADKWEQGLLTEAAPLYEKALADGGLFPSDVVVAYARIGTVHAASGRKEAALSAFRVAAVIDPAFQLPLESGPIAKKLYDQARSQAQKQGGKLDVSVESPEKADAGKGFSVTAKLPEEFAPVVEKVGIEIKDTMSKTSTLWKSDAPATASVQFDVPGKFVQGGTTLLVRVSALDQHANRWATKEVRVKVMGGVVESPMLTEPQPEEEKPEEKKSSFWSSPWPYVIGGVIVAGVVSTILLTRPSDQVSVGAPAWAR